MTELADHEPRRTQKARDFREILAEELNDPEFRSEWEKSAPARALADVIERNRVRKGLTQTALARLVGVSQPVIARIEAHEHTPTIETLIKLANALDIEIVIGIASRGTSNPVMATVPEAAQESREETTIMGARLIVATR